MEENSRSFPVDHVETFEAVNAKRLKAKEKDYKITDKKYKSFVKKQEEEAYDNHLEGSNCPEDDINIGSKIILEAFQEGRFEW